MPIQFPSTRPLLFALLVAPLFSIYAIGIDPAATATPSPYDKDASSILQSLSGADHNRNAAQITLSPGSDKSAAGPSSSLTSSELAIGEDSTLSKVGSDHLLSTKGKASPAPYLYPDDSRFTITIEGLAISEGFVMPDRSTLIAMGTIAAVATVAALYFRHRWRCNGRRMRFGVLWNGYRKPLCMKCDGPLNVLNDFSFQCPSCRVELGAYGDNGRTISPQEALERIQLKQYWSSN